MYYKHFGRKPFFTLYQQFCFLSSLLALFRWRTSCRWIKEWAFLLLNTPPIWAVTPEQAPPNSNCRKAALDHLRLHSKCSNVQRIFSLLWKLFSKSFLWMNWQICMVFPALYLLELTQILVPSPPACTTGWIRGYFMVMQYLIPALHLMNFFFFKVNMKILASKKKLSINLKYMQVQGKGKGKTSCEQGLHISKI